MRTDANTAFGEDVQRGYKQKAAFASIDLDLIPKVLTLTGGARFYKYDEFEHGSEYYSESTSKVLVVNHLNGVCTAAGLCGFPINLDKSESGHRLRGNLTWHVTSDLMTYYTYSEGFRPGGFNRTSSLPGQPPTLKGGVVLRRPDLWCAAGQGGPEMCGRRQPLRSHHQPVQQAGRIRFGPAEEQRDRLQERVARITTCIVNLSACTR